MDDSRARLTQAVWLLATAVLWFGWHQLMQYVSAWPSAWLGALTPPDTASPTGVAGLYDQPVQVAMLSALGLAFGYAGVFLPRRLGAPRAIWIPAALVSLLAYLSTAVFWAGFSGSGTGLANVLESFAHTLLLAATVALGAWLGSRPSGVRLTSASS